MFFTPKIIIKNSNAPLRFDASTSVVIGDCAVTDFVKSRVAALSSESDALLCTSLEFVLGIPDDKRAELDKMGRKPNDEEYIIDLGEKSVVYASKPEGFVFAVATLEQLKASDELVPLYLYDAPDCGIRGYRVFLPGRETIGEFKQMIDMLAYYKFNAIILEIGGAMEYKNHPEINEAWVEFCDDVRRYSGRAHEIQFKMYPWAKNSIHCDNGDGGFISQDECRDIAAYCRARGINVIPEEPTLSHVDYMLLRRPDLREQALDEYADTYCPSNPESYKLAFELLDEVIDVFKPEYINIGHDECYTIGICEKCKGKSPVELYVSDITKVHDYLASKGVKTMMWGEKLLDARADDGVTPIGGAETRRTNPDTGESYVYIPALYECADKLPRDIKILHWYWGFDYNYDRVYHDNGYEMVFGNLSAQRLVNWRERINWGAKGGFVSNWGSNAEEYLQRNIQMFSLLFSAYCFWSDDYDYCDRDEVGKAVIAEYYRRRHENFGPAITIVHTTEHYIKHVPFYDGIFIDDAVYMLGNYVVTYDDGTTALLPVKYGTNIAFSGIDPSSLKGDFTQVCGATLPTKIDGKLYFECPYKNPFPTKKIVDITYKPLESKQDAKVSVKSVKVDLI